MAFIKVVKSDKQSIKKIAGTVQIDMEDYIESLDSRLNEAESRWGGAPELHEQLLNYVEEVYDGQKVPSASVIADNFVINGEFIYKDDFTPEGNYRNYYEKYNGSWEQLCENEGILYNDEVCCIRLGF